MSWLLLFIAFFAEPWMSSDVVQPEALAARIGHSGEPMIVHVGFPLLYRGAHITGAVFAGPGSKPAGVDELKRVLAPEPRDREIVLYCGCCPWEKCPNVRPAYAAVREMGFTKVRILMIPENMAKDWVDKGYPTQKNTQ
jgi:thiosulfate/3-mercaptopyruvate sulfurtransferase